MKWLTVALLVFAAPVFAQEAGQEEALQHEADRALQKFPETAPPHDVLLHPHREQRDKYLWGTFGPPGVLDAALGAALGQWQNTPDEWGQTQRAFVKRFATEYAEAGINSTTKYVVARLRDEDPSFHPCTCSGLHRRALHAIISPVMAYRFDDGNPQFSAARIAGTAASSFVSGNLWKPGGQNAGTQLAHVGFDLLGAASVDLLREFVFHHRAPK
jgi:hypothetical protein